MVSMETVRQQLDELLEQTERDCAEAMEATTARAAEQVRADRAALIALGRQQERERTLLAIALVGAELKERGGNAHALATLRRYVLGDD
jgi:hypothetical protein